MPVEEDNDSDVVAAMFKVSFINDLPVTAADIAAASAKDPVLTQVYQYVLEGWPQTGVKDNLYAFYQRKDYLSTDQGCVLWGTRVLIPESLQAHLLNELHDTHPGIVKMKLRTRMHLHVVA